MVRPTPRRQAVGWLQTRGTSMRPACRVIGLSRATWGYQRRSVPRNGALLDRLQAHALTRPRFGYRRLHILISAGARLQEEPEPEDLPLSVDRM